MGLLSVVAFVAVTLFLPYRIRVSKGLPGSAAWQMAQKNIVQVAFVRWRGDSKIVEANAEHDFRLKRLIGMLRTKAKQVLRHKFFVQYAKRAPQPGLLTPESYNTKRLLQNSATLQYIVKTTPTFIPYIARIRHFATAP